MGLQCSCDRTKPRVHTTAGGGIGKTKPEEQRTTTLDDKDTTMAPHLIHGRCGGDSHKPSEAKTDQGMDSNEHYEGHNEEESNGQNHHSNEREDPAMSVPLVTPQKWSDSQARRTSDA